MSIAAARTRFMAGKEAAELDQGALRRADGSVRWCVWAPRLEDLTLVAWSGAERWAVQMMRQNDYFLHEQPEVTEGTRYCYRLADGRELPDPASRWQPGGVHGASAVFSPGAYRWADQGWRGVARDELVIYELHVGTFTPEGTFAAIIPRVAELRRLGITALEIMPIAQFPGERNWGYDGVFPYAAQNSYGGPQGLQRLVDAAHQAGMAVLLDVGYNHLGPEGNYLREFGPYFTATYKTPWGDAVNYDGPDSDPVRKYVVDNACYWVGQFHLDGLRLDAVHTIYDHGARHLLAEIKATVEDRARQTGRLVHVIAESDQNDVRLVNPPERGGFGLDAVWADDFHHAVHTLLTGEREGYYVDFGRLDDLAKAYEHVFIYDGGYSPFRRRQHGSRTDGLSRAQFVVCIYNHDQVGNRADGSRGNVGLPEATQRLAAGLLLVSPATPMLFMGEEYGETRPFPFFCSFEDAELAEAVRCGRREEFAALDFAWCDAVPDPQDVATFVSAKLTWAWPEGTFHSQIRRLYGDLLAARRQWPGLRDRFHTRAHAVVAGDDPSEPDVLIIERGEGTGLIVAANFAAEPRQLPALPLLGRELLLSTEWSRYGGSRRGDQSIDTLAPSELVVFGPGDWRLNVGD